MQQRLLVRYQFGWLVRVFHWFAMLASVWCLPLILLFMFIISVPQRGL